MNDVRSLRSRQHSLERAAILTGSLPAIAGSVGELRHRIVDFAREHGAGRADRDRIALAVTEAAANVVVHAYTPGRRGELSYLADLEDGDLQVIVGDDGDGIRERPRTPGSGLGLKLIDEMTTDFDITPRTPTGVEVWMRFLLDPAGD